MCLLINEMMRDGKYFEKNFTITVFWQVPVGHRDLIPVVHRDLIQKTRKIWRVTEPNSSCLPLIEKKASKINFRYLALWQWYLLFDWFLAFFKYLLGNKFIRYKQMFLTYRWDSQHLVKIVFCIERIVAMLIR